MKKTVYFLLTALSIAALSSCIQEITPEEMTAGKSRTYTIELAPSTRTDITAEGKTVWKTGDQILLTDGTTKDTVVVAAADNGKAVATIEACLLGTTVYAIYPASAAAATPVADGKVNVVIPTDQSGVFADANIAVAKSDDCKFQMKNATAVMKVSTPEDGLYVILNSAGNPIAGKMAVTIAEDGSLATEISGSSGVVTCEAPTADVYYLAVAPGTYQAGFGIMAVNTETGKFQSKNTTADQTLAVNDMANLGMIGTDLSGFQGEGTEASPFLINSLGEMLALANSVNVGNTYKDQYFKVTNDIEGVSLPVGYCDVDDRYFKGHFDGDNHTITVDIDGSRCKVDRNVALFGDAAEPASFKNLTVAGKVTSSGNYVAGLLAMVNAVNGVTITNVTNKAAVSGNGYVGGIIGYCDAGVASGLVVENCTNEGEITATSNYAAGIAAYTGTAFNKLFKSCANKGKVTGNNSVGGIVGYGYYAVPSDCTNSGDITATATSASPGYGLNNNSFVHFSGYNAGIGGIIGWAQNCGTISNCTNSGAVTGPNKVGGIAGSTYWTALSSCSNSGNITGSVNWNKGINFGSYTGGIVGWVDTRYDITNCTNTGDITGNGGTGGIAGVIQSISSAVINVKNCENSGKISAKGECTGGIVGLAWSQGANKHVCVTGCKNTGEVVSTSNSAGGVVGKTYDANNSGTGVVEKCVNTANVTGTYYAGGVVGYAQSRATKGITTMRNCENHGNVLSTRTDAQPAYTGGIVGNSTNVNDGYGFFMYNCFNTGDVTYSNVDYAKPYVGGVIGNQSRGKIANVYSSGKVGPISDAASEAQEGYIGALCGGAVGSVTYAYYLAGTANNFMGTACAGNYSATEQYLISVDEVGMLEGNAMIKDVSYTMLVDALNAWVAADANPSLYYKWGEGPVFETE